MVVVETGGTDGGGGNAMSARFRAGLAIALALPVLLLGWMVLDAERRSREGEVVRVVLRGYDPRDLLRGQYILYQDDWNWAEPPEEQRGYPMRVCVRGGRDPLKGDPVVALPAREIDGAGCRVAMDGYLSAPGRRVPGLTATFDPRGLGERRLYVDERRAKPLEDLLRDGKIVLTIDLAIRADGQARFKAWHIDGMEPEAYFARPR